jgi:hypothetical protein
MIGIDTMVAGEALKEPGADPGRQQPHGHERAV